MEFRTKVNIRPPGRRLDYGQRGLSLGSCFAENIAERMRRVKLAVECNPFGIMFNPVSVADTLWSLAEGRVFAADDLVRDHDLWCSFSFHGGFSSVDAAQALSAMNRAATAGARALAEADYVIITFGTAWVYELDGGFDGADDYTIGAGVEPGRVVVNCHKFPAGAFGRRRMEADEIVALYDALLAEGGPLYRKNVIMTVSPVRHVKDGLHENNLSKAALLLAADRLASRYDNVYYFPAYEIVNDELRDYRFFAADMVHPSAVAADYVWEQFRDNALSAEAVEMSAGIGKIVAAAAHRPFNTESASHRDFLRSMLARALEFSRRYPCVDLTEEIEYFSNTK